MNLRRCCICNQPIIHLPEARTTCGQPRCVRSNRSRPKRVTEQRAESRRPRSRPKREDGPDIVGRSAIREAWERSADHHRDWNKRLIYVCQVTNEAPASVMSVLKSLGY